MHVFLSNLANRQTDRQTRAKHVPPLLSDVINCLSVVHCSHLSLHSITESTAVSLSSPLQYSLSSMSSSQATCPYDSSCHLKWALMQIRFIQHTPVMQVLPASPELLVQVYQRLPAFAAKSWMVTRLRSLIQHNIHSWFSENSLKLLPPDVSWFSRI